MNENPTSEIRIGQITALWAEQQGLASAYFPETTSTNDLAKDEAMSLTEQEPLKLYVTDHQTKGRGRNSNSWTSTVPGAQLLSSWSIRLKRAPAPTLSPLVGLCLHKAASATWPFLNFSLKAPNDLYIDDKKVAGVLLESITQGQNHRLILGLGLNVFAAPKSVNTATSIAQKLPAGTPLLGDDWSDFLDRFVFEITISISRPGFLITTTEQLSLLKALNDFPLLNEKYTAISEDGLLKTKTKEIHWSEI